jgi:acetylornithine/succinyldiaminopimelate/putrescine aminotransferase
MFKGEVKERRKSVIRLQPPAFIEEAEIEKLINAFDETFNIISKNNEFVLVAHLVNY